MENGEIDMLRWQKYMPYYCYWLQLKRMRTERALISWNALPYASSVFKVFKNVQI